jgi:hypothetical protein
MATGARSHEIFVRRSRNCPAWLRRPALEAARDIKQTFRIMFLKGRIVLGFGGIASGCGGHLELTEGGRA